MSRLRIAIKMIWASPWTLFGLLVGLLGLATGGQCRRRGRTLEFWGGLTTWFLHRFPLVKGVAAVTFGHVILGCDSESLDRVRPHELVHVRQYELWGLMLVPAYLFHWVRLSFQGRDPYRDNPFERQALDEEKE